MTREEINIALRVFSTQQGYDVSNWGTFWADLPFGRLKVSNNMDGSAYTVVVSFTWAGFTHDVYGTDIALTVCEAWLLWKGQE